MEESAGGGGGGSWKRWNSRSRGTVSMDEREGGVEGGGDARGCAAEGMVSVGFLILGVGVWKRG